MSTPNTNSRYYDNAMPSVGTLVMAKVHSMSDTSAYVRLLEYGGIEGMIPYTELSRRRIRSINQYAKVGKLQVATVIRLDSTKGYIDLSKKQVTAEERKKCEEWYQKSKTVTQIIHRVAAETEHEPVELMKQIAWPLYKKNPAGHAYDELKAAVGNPDGVFGPLNLDPKVLECLKGIVGHKLKAEMLKLQAEVNVTCFTIEGVDAIRDVLKQGQEAGEQSGSLLVHIQVTAPPTYTIATSTEDREEGLKALWDCIETLKTAMAKRGGSVDLPLPPHVVGHDDGPIAGEEAVEGSSDEDDE
jgi:translation initiation factor 2 subunit 1